MKIRHLLFIFISTLMLTACTTSTGSNESIRKEPSVEEFILVEDVFDSESYIEEYRSEIRQRVINPEEFLSDSEKELLESEGYTTFENEPKVVYYNAKIGYAATYWYPVLFSENSGEISLWSTDEDGNLNITRIKESSESTEKVEMRGWIDNSDSYKPFNVHYSLNENYEIFIEKHYDFIILYDKVENVISFSQFGKVYDKYKLSTGSVYKGYNYALEHLFLQCNDVYSVYCSPYYGVEVEVIAHDVEDVIATKYNNETSEINEPIFKMTDGSYKVYRRPYSSTEAVDSIANLVELGK